jgi:hypothetical protein
VTNPDSGKALAQFDRRQADLAVLRTDAKVPPRARALAILEHDVLLLLSPPNKKIKSLAELKKKKIAVLADGDHNRRSSAKSWKFPISDAASAVQLAPPNSPFDKLFASGGYGAAIAIAHASTIVNNKSYEQYAKRGAFTLNAIDERKRWRDEIPQFPRKRWRRACCPRRPRFPMTISYRRAAMAAGRAVQDVVGDRGRTRAHDLRKQGRARAAGWLRLQDRTGGHRQGRLSLSHTRARPNISMTTPSRSWTATATFCISPRQRSASSARYSPRSTPR